jgi:ATP-dependent DNA ligase
MISAVRPRWIHEIKHDGYRLMARRDPVGVRRG